MRAVVVAAPGEVTLAEVMDPGPASDGLVLAVERCGICGTDRHLLAGDNPFARYPVIPGHEFTGVVVAAGREATRLEVGRRVAVDPSRSCGACEQCRGGWPNLCPDKGGHGSRKPGGVAEYVAVAETACEPLPEDLDPGAAALAEPLACVLHGMDNLGPVLGERVLVVGAGPIGLLATALIARAGARDLVVCDRNPARLACAPAFGASETCEDAAAAAGDFHAVVDATGNAAAMQGALERLRPGGRFLVLGVADPRARIEISPFEVNWRGLRIIGSMAIRHTFGRAVDLLAHGGLEVGPLVTAVVGLEGFAPAVAALGHGTDLKTQIDPAGGADGRSAALR